MLFRPVVRDPAFRVFHYVGELGDFFDINGIVANEQYGFIIEIDHVFAEHFFVPHGMIAVNLFANVFYVINTCSHIRYYSFFSIEKQPLFMKILESVKIGKLSCHIATRRQKYACCEIRLYFHSIKWYYFLRGCMKITVVQISDNEQEEITVKCHKNSQGIASLLRSLSAVADGITARKDGEIFKVRLIDVFWFEVVENRAFLYLEHDVYECKLKLYEFEELTRGMNFFRATKSTVINADKIESVAPTFSGRFSVKFNNGERGIVSRGYVSALKNIMGL